MSELLDAISGGARPMIGMIQLQPLAGSSRHAGDPITAVLEHALAEAAILSDAGFPFLMVQNLHDLPVAQRASAAQVAWITRVLAEVRSATSKPVGLNLLENDADAMFAVASAGDADFVRIKVYTGAMVTPAGIEAGQAFEAIRARTLYGAAGVAIFADVHDRTGVPVATAGLLDDIRTALAIGGADGIVLTGRSHAETMTMLGGARDAFPKYPILAGGGVNHANVRDVIAVASGAIVSSALKGSSGLFGALDPAEARAFMQAATSS
jgi:membrane complex biogenesis BtpA family protein